MQPLIPQATIDTVSPILQSVVSPDVQQGAGSWLAKQAKRGIPTSVKNTRAA